MILPFRGKHPQLGAGVFVAPTASIVGDVQLGPRASVWFGAVLRGDDFFIRIGEETNIQDNVVIHEGRGSEPAVIGRRVTIGHAVTLHGSRVGDLCLLGMGATILDGCEIGEGCLIAAGALLPPGLRVPAGKLVLGAPARIIRDLRPDERAQLEVSAASYVALAAQYLSEPWCRPARTASEDGDPGAPRELPAAAGEPPG
jgi:carbonic anhydrase/acetyltransferase-like protein (isoleucine patch superfamily)